MVTFYAADTDTVLATSPAIANPFSPVVLEYGVGGKVTTEAVTTGEPGALGAKAAAGYKVGVYS